MADPVFKPKLPSFGNQDGDQVITSSGVIYEFNTEKREWVNIGVSPSPEIVDPTQDGLVSPELHRKLVLIQELIEQGFDFSKFKLATDVEDPYYYLFHSSDDLIKFIPERVSEPREIIADFIVAHTADLGDDTTEVAMSGNFPIRNNEWVGLTFETIHGSYIIASNTDLRFIVNSNNLNIFGGDRGKIVKPEIVQTRLRIEIDKGRLYQKLIRNCCVGPKGTTGDVGDTGSAGVSASNEEFQLPVGVTGGVFSWDTTVQTPITTPISLRIFKPDNDEVVAIEVLHPLDGSNPLVVINDPELGVEETSFDTNYEVASKRFFGSVVITGAGDFTGWRFKARQSGAKGAAGSAGKAFVEVVERLLDDPSIRSTQAVISARKAAASDDVIILRNELFEQVPVSNLAALDGDSVSNILFDQFVAAKFSISDSKDIGFFQFSPKDFIVPPLDIPSWTPTGDCVQARRWSQYRFNWFVESDPNYLFSIMSTPKPPEACCVAGETFIHCSEGLRRIKTLDVGDKVLCPDGEFRAITKFYDNGEKECLKLIFSDGSEIVCTPDHRFPVGGELVEAKDLQLWDQVYKAPGVLGHVKKSRHGNGSDFNRGYVIGYLLGDGWISNDSIGICAPHYEKDGFDRVYKILSKLFGKVKIQKRYSGDCLMFYTVWASKKAVNHYLDQGWYKSLPESRMEIPDSIYVESYQFYKGFFSALINTDGSVTVDGINLDWSILKILPQTVKRLVDYLGFGCSLLEQVRSKNKFKELSENSRCHRVDLLQGSISNFIPLISEGLIKVKKNRVKGYPNADRENIQLPVNRSGEDYNDGLIAGAFMFSGGFNRETERAWINPKMPIGLRSEIGELINRKMKDFGSIFYKKAGDIVNKVDEDKINFQYALGFIRSAIYHRNKLAVNGSFIINKNQEWESNFIARCLDVLGIKFVRTQHKTPSNKIQYRINIKTQHNIYKLFCMSGHRDKLFNFGLTCPRPKTGVVVLKKVEEVGIKHVYDYEVPPHFMMMAEGIMPVECQEDFFFCPNVGDQPCGIVGQPDPPVPFAVPCDCECENPIFNSIEDGVFVMNPIDLTDEDS